MSSTHRPAEAAAPPARSAHDGTPLAPKWVPAARPRKIIPLRLSAAPQTAAGPIPALPGSPTARLSGPDLLAQDAVFRQLLSAKSDPATAQPMRDPVGLALGVVARLMVAACAAAAVTMLLVGALPLPSWPHVAAKSEMLAPARPARAVEAAAATPRLAADLAAASAVPMVKDAAPAGEAKTAADAAPVRVSTVTVHARPADGADQAALAPDEIARLVKRGEDSLAQGDIAAARLILGRAAEAHDAQAALSFGATFDPAVLRQLHVIGFRPDIAQARAWYEKSAGYGSVEAAQRLAALPRLER